MQKNESNPAGQKVCDLNFLTVTMGGNKLLVSDIMKEFLIQVPVELQCMKSALGEVNYQKIKSYAHSMKSTFSIMGISMVIPLLSALELIGSKEAGIEEARALDVQLCQIANQALEEIRLLSS
jgi:hypothetical protein